MHQTQVIDQAVLDAIDAEFNQLSFLPVKELKMHGNELIVTSENSNAHRYLLGSDARNYLGEFTKAPTPYLAKLGTDAHDLSAAVWNYHIQKRGSDVTALKAVIKGSEIKGFTARTHNPLSPSQVIQSCSAGMPGAVFERTVEEDSNGITFYLTSPELYHDFGEAGISNDVHHFSVGTQYHFMGDSVPSVRTYGHRHGCGNIMVAGFDVDGRQFRINTTQPEQVRQKFTEFTRKGTEFVKMTLIPHIKGTMDTSLNGTAEYELNDLFVNWSIPEKVRELILEAYKTEDLGHTEYHLVNALTRAANSERCPEQWVSQLREIAGDRTVKFNPDSHKNRCNSCHHVLATK